MIGDEGRLLVAVVKIKEAHSLGCDCVRESEHRGSNGWKSHYRQRFRRGWVF